MTSTPDDRRPLKYGVVAVARRGDRFLAIRRGAAVAAPGRLCFPGGHVEPGEAERDAVARECHEELAVVGAPLECVWRNVTAWRTALAWWTVDLHAGAEIVPHPVEVAEVLWLTAEEMMAEPTLLDGNRTFLEAVAGGSIRL